MKKILLISILSLAACNSNTVYSEFDRDFPENHWNRNDVRNYEFDIADAEKPYSLFIDFSYVAGVSFPDVPVEATLNDGKSDLKFVIQLKTTSADGNETGDCDGDFCDILIPVFEGKRLIPGHYKVSLENKFGYKFLPNVLGLGIKVTKDR